MPLLAFRMIQEVLGRDDTFVRQLLELLAHLAAKFPSCLRIFEKLRYALAIVALMECPGCSFRERQHSEFDVCRMVARILDPFGQLFDHL